MYRIERLYMLIRGNNRAAAGAGIVLVLLVVAGIAATRGTSAESTGWVEAVQGPFTAELVESGSVRAVRSVDVEAPMEWRMELQVIDMVPEGTIVEAGDFLVQFDASTLEEELEGEQDELEQAAEDLKELREKQKTAISELEDNLLTAQYTLEAAELSLELLKFESEIRKETARLDIEKARLALDEAKKRIENQKIIHAGELMQTETRVKHAQAGVERMHAQIDNMTLRAPSGGMVVYQEIDGGSSGPHKLTVGDKVDPGRSLVSIPDLSEIQVTTRINEIDEHRVRPGQTVEVRLDAYEDRIFTGTVASIAPLIEREDANSRTRRYISASGQAETVEQVPTFELVVLLDESDEVLKPGMTARIRIILDTAGQAVSIPISAVFEDDAGNPVVYPKRGFPYSRPVTLGMRNDRFMVIEEGLSAGEQVALAPAVDDAYPLGWNRETRRRSSAVAEVVGHLDRMAELGLTGEPIIAETTDLSGLPPFLQGFARMFEQEGCPLSNEQIAAMDGIQPGADMNDQLSEHLNEDQLQVMERNRRDSSGSGMGGIIIEIF